jgi:protein-L-isoaspartate(D-aspartate) O-methyltransferase
MNEMNFEQARFNMIEQQIRTWEVLDQRVLDVIASTPREDFVPERYRQLAFADINIPLDHGQAMMQPKLEGRILQVLAIQPSDSVLEIGTGSGYLTACLAKLGRNVHSVEIFPELTHAAQKRLAAHAIQNVALRIGDASAGWDVDAPYDVIAVTGSTPVLPPGFQQGLAIGGRLFVVVGQAPAMEALLITRVGENEWTRESLFETVLPPLVNASQSPRFVL